MTRGTREEDRSHAGLFALASLGLLATSLLTLWVEVDLLRPWKKYQREYFALERSRLLEELRRAREEFESPEVQERYRRLEELRRAAREESREPEAKARREAAVKEIEDLKLSLSELQRNLQVLRGRRMEKEYLYNRYGSEDDGEAMNRLDRRIEKIRKERETLTARKNRLREELHGLEEKVREYSKQIEELRNPIEELEARLDELRRPEIRIRQIYVEPLGRVDRCTSCHLGIERPESLSSRQPFRKHPAGFLYLENHPPERFGCTVCHDGQGRATSSVEKAHGKVEHWPYPLLAGRQVQASCRKCHESLRDLRGAEWIRKGEQVLETYGCFGCHNISGYQGRPKIGPPLSEIGRKASYSWVVQWLMEPREVYGTSRMPDFGFSREEAEAIADYLFSQTQEARVDHPVPEIDEDLYEAGRILFRQSRCTICHPVSGRGGAFREVHAPDLGIVGSKIQRDWLLDWIGDPKVYFPTTRMPRFRFTPEMVRALAEYLQGDYVDWDLEERKLKQAVPIRRESIARGAALIRTYGCSGCHDILGMEEMKKIGPYLRRSELDEVVGAELSSIGSKPLEQLDFGRLRDLPRDRATYIRTKLKTPRAFRDGLRMPDFHFSDEQIDALTTLLVGFTPAEIEAMPWRYRVRKEAAEFRPPGEVGILFHDLKCLTCHSIRGTGGDFAPDLTIEGSKVRREWLVDFLRSPNIIRPLLKQMPRLNIPSEPMPIWGSYVLTEGELELIANFIMTALVSADIPADFPEEDPGKDAVRLGREIYRRKGCRTCHQMDGDGGALGPDLTFAGDRLVPGYIYTYLRDPQGVNPEVVMPNFNLSEEEAGDLAAYLSSRRRTDREPPGGEGTES